LVRGAEHQVFKHKIRETTLNSHVNGIGAFSNEVDYDGKLWDVGNFYPLCS
jgi:hypothetical protein